MAKKCKSCANLGNFPACYRCGRDRTGKLPMAIRIFNEKEKEKKRKAKRKVNELSREELIKEESRKEDDKILTKMFHNMRKCNMTTTGCPETDKRIYEIFGKPETWIKIVG